MAKRETGLYRREGSTEFAYDFRVRGHRFSGSTGTANRREAEHIVRAKKEEARKASAAALAPLTFGRASTRWYEERGQHAANPREMMAQLARLQGMIGLSTPLTAITNSMVAQIAAKRRADGVSNATVNRSVIEPLRRILKRAAEAWDAPVPKIAWAQHKLPEPRERIRAATEDEEARIMAVLPEDFRLAVRFAIISGCRLSEITGLTWGAIDWGGRTVTIDGKGGKVETIPLSHSLRSLLFPLQGRHPEAVFAYHPFERGKALTDIKAPWRPITTAALARQWRRARLAAGIASSRADRVSGLRFHDLRHTTATRILRETGNLKLVSKLLRHSDIATTAKYAHVIPDEIAAAMDQASTPKLPQKLPQK